jgi:hypothetical protein
MATSIIYRSPLLYELIMVALYRADYQARYAALADLIPENSSLLELCCGPAILYRRYLRSKNVLYRGLDISSTFVRKLTAEGISSDIWDLKNDRPLPSADYVLMQASLYHFLPDARPVLNRMLAAARHQVIVAEPIRNLASCASPFVRRVASVLSNAGEGREERRFTEQTLDALACSLGPQLKRSFLAPGGREKICIFKANEVCSPNGF